MGIYEIGCPVCKKPYLWFSGNADQRCGECKKMSDKPREADVALETEEYKAWRASGKATRETCPLNIKSYEKVRMIEYSAYEDIKTQLACVLVNNGKLQTERDEARAALEKIARNNYAGIAVADAFITIAKEALAPTSPVKAVKCICGTTQPGPGGWIHANNCPASMTKADK